MYVNTRGGWEVVISGAHRIAISAILHVCGDVIIQAAIEAHSEM